MQENADPFIQQAALVQLLEATLSLLGHWAQRLPGRETRDGLLYHLRHYLLEESEKLRAVVDAANAGVTKPALPNGDTEPLKPDAVNPHSDAAFDKAVLTGFLWWILVTEWCWDRIRMD